MRTLKGKGLPDLKPCPFCGRPAEIRAKDIETVNRYNAPQEVTGTRGFYFVGCFDGPCEIHPHSYSYEKGEAVRLWNNREVYGKSLIEAAIKLNKKWDETTGSERSHLLATLRCRTREIANA